MKSKLIAAGLCLALATPGAFAQKANVPKPVAKSMSKVKPADIKAHIAYLADDKLLGRQPGTPGYQMAVDYVTDQFKELGVTPAGENNTYLQTVRLRTATTNPDVSLQLKSDMGDAVQLISGQDFTFYPNPGQAQVALNAPLVFAGYGISAPDMNYDDYANIDAKGKIVVVLRGTPEGFPATVASYSTDTQTLLKTAAEHGAVGVMIGSTNPRGGVPNFSRGVSSVMGADGKVATSRSYHEAIDVLGMISYNTLQKLLAGAGTDVQQVVASISAGKPASAPLPFNVTGSYGSTYKDFESYNVVGKIEGSDPKLKNEYVVHSAHLDHVGIGRPIDGDSIYNGAHDNASGVASLLEIANVYSRLDKKPKRSVLIVMVTAEEMGLLGSAYFAKHPTVPAAQIVADVNTDMPTLIAPLLAVVPLGAAHSSLEDEVKQASKYLGLDVEQDPEPDQNRFVRSDQYSFVTQGVPALHIKYGNKTADGKNNLDEQVKVWREKYYHKPQDGLENGIFDFEAAKKYVQLNFLIGYLIAQDAERPNWNEGDFFGTRFGKVQ
ncbi:M28 family peptidase [Pontibacter akesuensis]|uniref:Zn-dependent amino-or carboxypeptidase, M28 family n=1 Tax=Pontibacter akesuensis TaxID=388950 RepID=A0A1I7GSB3_9BACT|nr:M28 family peptidase [Pontibacter akesuensis]GHA55322.1 aminopeptidase [Pontibacter akesuensis]SFU51332.1 Zn-dependent amino-or carboxypeptidase, M28 family [Pontibacter akesuensis]